MDRRRLLEVMGMGALTPLLPGILRAGPSNWLQDHTRDEPRCANPYVRSTLDRASRLGKSTLVLVVPEDRRKIWERQTLFGEFLNYCSTDVLLDLSLCEVVCASQADLAVHVPGAAEAEDPLMILVALDGSPSFLCDDLPPVSRGFRRREDVGELEAEVLARVEALGRAVRDLVAPDAKAVERNAALAKSLLDPSHLARIEVAEHRTSSLDPQLADEAAAVVRARLDESAHTQGLRSSLVAGTTFRLRQGPPFGAQWATSLSCGLNVESAPEGHPAAREEPAGGSAMYLCGMAHTPEISKRFLKFWRSSGTD